MKKRSVTKKRSQLLRLTHHSHTGRLVPKHHTSYPLLVLLVVLVGVFLAGSNMWASAANPDPISHDLGVHASVKGIPPAVPAEITSPTDGSTVTHVPVTVTGTCEPGSMVKLYRNNFFSGAVMCAADGTFTLDTDLFEGDNELQARSYNATDDEGPVGTPIHVTYKPAPPNPILPTTPGTAAGALGPEGQLGTPAINPTLSGLPLAIKAENLFRGYYTNDLVTWKLEILGGTAPYAILVDWGDGKTDVISRKDSGTFEIFHTYTRAGNYKGSYPIKIRASDSNGSGTFMQLMVIINNKKDMNSVLPGATRNMGNDRRSGLFGMITWSTLGVCLVGLLGFWLGELQELKRLTPYMKSKRLRTHTAARR